MEKCLIKILVKFSNLVFLYATHMRDYLIYKSIKYFQKLI